MTIVIRWLQTARHRRAITTFDILVFFRQFSALIAAGIPLLQSLDLLTSSQSKIAMRALLHAIKRDILSGKPFYQCLRQHTFFTPIICHLIQLGEHTGKLDTMLTLIANDLEKHNAFVNRIKQALFYPCIIALTGTALTLCMFIFIIPRFADLFADMPGKLPALTLAIFYLSKQLRAVLGWPLVISMAITYAVLHYQSLTITQALQQAMAKLPFVRDCLRKLTLARFARNLAITYAAGIPIIDALKLAGNASGNADFIHIMTQVRAAISTGLPLHQTFRQYTYFPPLMIQLVKTGEETGMLDEMLLKVAAFFESDIDHVFQRISQLLEPLIMVVLGVLIGGLVAGMYLPIFKLGSII